MSDTFYIPYSHDRSKPEDPNCHLCMAGIPVYTSAMVPAFERVQVRFPRSKKVRIRKKWSKDPRNWRTIPYVRFMSMRKDKMDQLILTHRQTMDAWLKQFGVGGKVSLDTETNGL